MGNNIYLILILFYFFLNVTYILIFSATKIAHPMHFEIKKNLQVSTRPKILQGSSNVYRTSFESNNHACIATFYLFDRFPNRI